MACFWLETWYRRLIVILFTCSREFYTSTAQILSIPHDSCYVFVLVSSPPIVFPRVSGIRTSAQSAFMSVVFENIGRSLFVWQFYWAQYVEFESCMGVNTHTHTSPGGAGPSPLFVLPDSLASFLYVQKVEKGHEYTRTFLTKSLLSWGMNK